MKILFFLSFISLCAITQTKSQINDTIANMNAFKIESDALLLKSKKQKTAAWILLGGGAGLTLSGIIIVGNQTLEDLGNVFNANHKPSNTTGGEILAYTGTAAILGSIPFFIASGKNKRKANLILKKENVFFNPELKNHIIALGMKIKL